MLVPASELPADLIAAAEDVGHDLGLQDDWLNSGPAALFERGFPSGIEGRLIRRRYGVALTVYFISRWDQIHFKMLAAMDPKAGTRQLEDLLDLAPDREEARAAVRWLLSGGGSDDFRVKLEQLLDRIGHGDLVTEF